MNHGEKILIAEDEADVQELVSLHLRNAGYQPVGAENGPEAIRRAREERPRLIVLDIMMEGMSGLEVCRLLKADPATSGIPLIMLTAKAEEPDRVVGLELGADDYMTKPFSPRELVLRIKSVLRRSFPRGPDGSELRAGVVSVDRERHVVYVRDKQVELTATEFKLLSLLIERRGCVQSRENLLNEVWGYESAAIDTRTVDTHVRRLREKLGASADCIETVRGFGYRVAEK